MISSLHHLPLILSALFSLAVSARYSNLQIPFINPLIPDSSADDGGVAQEDIQFVSILGLDSDAHREYSKANQFLIICYRRLVFETRLSPWYRQVSEASPTP